MKRILRLIASLFIVFSLSSCDLLLQLLGDGEEVTKDWEVDEKGDVYFVRYNTTTNYIIPSYAAGTVKSASRNAETDNTSNHFQIPNETGVYNDMDFITGINKQIANSMQKYARSAISNVVVSDINKVQNSIGSKKEIWVHKTDKSGKTVYDKDIAECMYVGTYCDVLFIDNNPYVSFESKDFKALGEKFDKIYPIETKVVGNTKYTSHDERFRPASDKVQIVLMDCFYDAEKEQTFGTFGYFINSDLYTEEVAEANNIHSNEGDFLYIDSQFYSYDGTKTIKDQKLYCQSQIYSTLAHEYNHCINATQKMIVHNKPTNNSSTWFTEMLSLTMEDLIKDAIDVDEVYSSRSRLDYFKKGYNYGFINWLDSTDVLYSYGNATAYGAFLCRNFGGEKLIHEIATNEYIDDNAITQALKVVNKSSKITFEDTIKAFAEVLINESSTTGYTLNKSGESTTYGITISPIDLSNYNTPTNFIKLNGKSEIGPSAFNIYYLGKNIKNFTTVEPSSSVKNYLDDKIIVK